MHLYRISFLMVHCYYAKLQAADYYSSKISQSAREIGVTIKPSNVKIVPISSFRSDNNKWHFTLGLQCGEF